MKRGQQDVTGDHPTIGEVERQEEREIGAPASSVRTSSNDTDRNKEQYTRGSTTQYNARYLVPDTWYAIAAVPLGDTGIIIMRS